jgi:transcriptional regulator with XRE-family HTH domain
MPEKGVFMGRKDKPVPTEEDVGPLMRIGACLRRARQQAGVRLSELAKDIGYTKGHLSAVENGISRPSLELIDKYAERLGVAREALVPPEVVAPLGLRRSPMTQNLWAELLGENEDGLEEGEASEASLQAIGRDRDFLDAVEALLEGVWGNPRISDAERNLLARFLLGGMASLQRGWEQNE